MYLGYIDAGYEISLIARQKPFLFQKCLKFSSKSFPPLAIKTIHTKHIIYDVAKIYFGGNVH